MKNADLVEYLSVACTGTGQATFYNTRKEQEQVLDGLHKKLLAGDRRIYALTSVLPVNDKNRQLIVKNLLSTGQQASDYDLEDHVIQFVIKAMQFNRVLNCIVDMCNAKVNNARMRRLCTHLWEAHGDAFHVIKYRDKWRRILRHCHIPEGDDEAKAELHRWIFGKIKKPADAKHNRKLKDRLRAPKEYECCFKLPFDIGRDIAVAHHSKTPDEFSKEFAGHDGKAAKGKVTRKESMRVRKTVKTAKTDINFGRFTLIELIMHVYRLPDEYEAVKPFFRQKAEEVADTLALPHKIAIVADNSKSATGSRQRELHPLAVIESTIRVCKALTESEVEVFYVGPKMNKYLKAEGASDLRMPLAKALASRPDLVLILSDGYENVRAGSVAQILNTKAVMNSGIAVIHLNPVTAAESGALRKLSDTTYGLTGPEQLPMAFLLGQAAVDPALLEPMFERIETALLIGDYRAAKLAVGDPMKYLPAPTM